MFIFSDCSELDHDEELIDVALDSEAFQFLRHSVLAAPNFFQEVHNNNNSTVIIIINT